MPELPEVEVLRRHLDQTLPGTRIEAVRVLKPRIVRPEDIGSFSDQICGKTILKIERRGKHLRCALGSGAKRTTLLIHLGMTGRVFSVPSKADTDGIKHLALWLKGNTQQICYTDPRTFGRWSCDSDSISKLGPEPFDHDHFTSAYLFQTLKRRHSPIKHLLMDQSIVAGLGNIYVNEVLHLSRIHPCRLGSQLPEPDLARLIISMREVLSEAIALGTRLTLDFKGSDQHDGLFYFGSGGGVDGTPEERFRVYDREGQPCLQCSTPISRTVMAQRSTYFCANCQPCNTG